MSKFQIGCLKLSKTNSLPNPFWNLLITFYWSLEISNGFLEMKFELNYQRFLVQIFLKIVHLLCLNEVWNFYFNHNSYLWLHYEEFVLLLIVSHIGCLTSYHPTCIKPLSCLLIEHIVKWHSNFKRQSKWIALNVVLTLWN